MVQVKEIMNINGFSWRLLRMLLSSMMLLTVKTMSGIVDQDEIFHDGGLDVVQNWLPSKIHYRMPHHDRLLQCPRALPH